MSKNIETSQKSFSNRATPHSQPSAQSSSSRHEFALVPASSIPNRAHPKLLPENSAPLSLTLGDSTENPAHETSTDLAPAAGTQAEAHPPNPPSAAIKAKIVRFAVRGTPRLSPRRPEGSRERTLDEALRCEGMDEAAWARSFKFYLDHASGKLREVRASDSVSGAPSSDRKQDENSKLPASEIDWKAFNETLKEWARHLERTDSSAEADGPVMVHLEHCVPRPGRPLPAPSQPALPGTTAHPENRN